VAEHKPRKESTVANVNSICAVIGKASYNKILFRLIDQKNKAMVAFLKGISFI
jgi:hypothetical protein